MTLLLVREAAKLLEVSVNDYRNNEHMVIALRCVCQLLGQSQFFFLGLV
jgi:hypothetical protein